MVFPTCESISSSTGVGKKCKINIAYNQQKPLCASTSTTINQKNCRMPDQLCSADSDFKFDFTPGSPVSQIALWLTAFSLVLTMLFSRSPVSTSHRCSEIALIRYCYSTLRFLRPYPFRCVLGILIWTGFRIWCLLSSTRTDLSPLMSWCPIPVLRVRMGVLAPPVEPLVFCRRTRMLSAKLLTPVVLHFLILMKMWELRSYTGLLSYLELRHILRERGILWSNELANNLAKESHLCKTTSSTMHFSWKQ